MTKDSDKNKNSSNNDEDFEINLNDIKHFLIEWIAKPFLQGFFYGLAFQTAHKLIREALVHYKHTVPTKTQKTRRVHPLKSGHLVVSRLQRPEFRRRKQQ